MFKVGKLIVVLVVLFGIFWYLGVLSYTPVKNLADSRMKSRVNWQFEEKQDKIDRVPNLDEAIRQNHVAKVEKDHYDYSIDHFPQNCPDQKRRDNGNRFTMDLSACKVGANIPLHFGDTLKRARWQARLYYFGKGEPQTELEKELGKQLLDVPADAEITPLSTEHDDGSSVKKVGPHLYEWMGYVKLIYRGNASYVELVRQ